MIPFAVATESLAEFLDANHRDGPAPGGLLPSALSFSVIVAGWQFVAETGELRFPRTGFICQGFCFSQHESDLQDKFEVMIPPGKAKIGFE